MNGKQAIEILIKLDTCFDMNFENDEKKYQMWVTKLTEKGDYEKTLRKTERYIEENRFKPVIADILVKKTHYIDQQDDYDDKTKRHLERLKNDPSYRQEVEQKKMELRKAMQQTFNKTTQEDVINDER